MFAITVLSSTTAPLAALALTLPAILPLVVLLLVAIRQQSDRARRLIVALCLAVAITMTAHAAEDGDFVILDPCRGLSPSDALYWLRNCWLIPYWPF